MRYTIIRVFNENYEDSNLKFLYKNNFFNYKFDLDSVHFFNSKKEAEKYFNDYPFAKKPTIWGIDMVVSEDDLIILNIIK